MMIFPEQPYFKEYTDSWIKGTVKDNELRFEKDGLPTEDTNQFPEKDFMVNMCFTKQEYTGVGEVFREEREDVSASVYDLSGRRVRPDCLAPGAYIRNGRKFIVR